MNVVPFPELLPVEIYRIAIDPTVDTRHSLRLENTVMMQLLMYKQKKIRRLYKQRSASESVSEDRISPESRP